MRILLVEPDLETTETLTQILAEQTYAIETVVDSELAWQLITSVAYDLLILDFVASPINGIELCQRVRSHGYQMPILLLNHPNTVDETAIGLDAGADDVMVQPVQPDELVARLRALLRRGRESTPPVLEWLGLRMDPSTCEVTYGARLLPLTPKEYALLELFLRHPLRVFSCALILEHLWAFEDTPSEEAVRTHIKGLRQKLQSVGVSKEFIQTVYGLGYRLHPSDDRLGRSPQSLATSDPLQAKASPPECDRLTQLTHIVQRLRHELEERQRVETALRRSQARLAGILEIADDAIICIDYSQSITLFNQGAERIFGYQAAEVLGQSLDCLLPQMAISAHRQHVRDFTHSPDTSRMMGHRRLIAGRRKDGSEFPAEASISRLELGQELILTVILRDISQRQASGQREQSYHSEMGQLLTSASEPKKLAAPMDNTGPK